MSTFRMLGRGAVIASLLLLAACQSMPSKNGASTSSSAPATTATTPETSGATKPESTLKETNNGALVAVYLADTQQQTGWTAVKLKSGTLYVDPRPVITRADLSNIRAGASKEGVGLLALGLNDAGQSKILDVTTQNPNKRLALAVGHTMLSAPSYTVPIASDQLVFPVGTEQNATAAARAIAGEPSDSGASGSGSAAPSSK
jgi:preprotein translocase subunit SecD